MIRYCLRLLLFATITLSYSYYINPHAYAADQGPGDEHWAGDLSISGFDSYVTDLVSDRQGNIYAGGSFTAFGGQIVSHIAKWDGSTWSSLGNGLSEPVNTLAVDSRGVLYTDVLVIPDSGLPETLIQRWNGTSWTDLEGDLSSLVDTLAEDRESNILVNDLVVDSQDRLYAGGYFYLAQSDKYIGYVARWDGSDWTLLGPGMNHTVYHLAVDGQDNLYAGGEFTAAGGVSANRIAKWDGVSWSALGSGLGGESPTIADMEADESGNLYVTGQFSEAGGIPVQLIAIWDGAAWSDLAPGSSSSWFEGESPTVIDLYVGENGDLFAGGSFATMDGVEANNIARWDGVSWSALSTYTGNGVNERVYAITEDLNGQVYAGGFFTGAGGLPAHHIARWDGSSWFTWHEGSEGGMNKAVDGLAVDQNGILYAGGYFTSIGEVSANHIARWDGTEWSPLGKGLNAPVRDLALDSRGHLYVGGAFITAGDVSVRGIARWDGTTWSALGEGMSAEHTASPEVWALAVDGQGNLYAGGDFTTAGGIQANYIARWDGTAWSSLGSGMDEQVTDLAVDSQGNLYAAGWFKRAGDVEARGIARWDGSSWSALGNELNLGGALEIGKDGQVYATGMFYIPPDSSTFIYIAMWDGSTWSPLGSGVDNFVNTLAVDREGTLYAAGDFTSAGGMPALRIARWNGNSWLPLGSGLGAEGDYSSIFTLVTDDSGNLYAGGQFTLAGNKPSANLAKWCPELETDGCRFSFEANSPEPALELTIPVPLPGATSTPVPSEPELTPTISLHVPGLAPTFAPTDNPTHVAPGLGMPGGFWIGVGILLAILLGGLLIFMSRRV
jgi:hypothetical protein